MVTALAPHPAPLVDEKVASEILGLAPGTLSVWRCTRRYCLPYTKIGRAVRYRVEDLEQFIESRTVGGDAQE
ncbi:MAG: helix-turn-helix domain-containing protein [Planctomycetes bacterium]|nr:helix-turn-helix domain-containing protein [Planctomycetota bacterium]MBU4400368.1 helix-turn-helix domain-containing protein [Planctomycetota bacterium]MCG2685363.1 helix-turn-helix domain-containing protein [Planctomycetales bacterium]